MHHSLNQLERKSKQIIIGALETQLFTTQKVRNFSTNQFSVRATSTRPHSNVIKELYSFIARFAKKSKNYFDCQVHLGFTYLLPFCEFLKFKMGCAFSRNNCRVPRAFRRKKVRFLKAGENLLTFEELSITDKLINGSAESLFSCQYLIVRVRNLG